MRMRLMYAVIVITALALAGAPADGSSNDKGGKPGSNLVEKFCHKVSFTMENEKDLGLTEDQVKGIEDISLRTRKELIKMEADIDVVGIDIEEALYQDNIDVPAVAALIDKRYDLEKDKTKVLAASFAALKVILTPEQKDKIKELWKISEKEESHRSDVRGMMKCPKCSAKMEKM